jgi:E3 ubiquitin-protein ligase XIAP
VVCYYCGIGLKNFDAQDSPITEHIYWADKCLYASVALSQHKFNEMVKEGPTTDRNIKLSPDEEFPSSSALEVFISKGSFSCKICMEQADVAFAYGCGHAPFCMKCSKKCKECPICRRSHKPLRLYF